MKVSIITICRNEKNTIAQTIESVLRQDYKDIEYIIIDGLSSDGTWEIIQGYQEHLHLCLHAKDHNLYDAMNKGLAHATGDIIYFLNANDFLDTPEVIGQIVHLFKNNPTAMIIQARTQLVKTPQSHQCYTPYSKPFKDEKDVVVNLPAHQGIFARRQVFDMIGNFNIHYDLFADYDWFLRAWYKGLPIHFTNMIAARCTPFGLSFTQRWVKLPQKIIVLIRNASPWGFLYYLFFATRRSVKKLLNLIKTYAHPSS